MIQIGFQDQIFMGFFNFECEGAFLLGKGAPGEGLGLTWHDVVLPEDGDGVEGVGEAVVVGERESEGGGVGGTCEREAGAGDGGRGGGGEVELGRVVELVGGDTIDLGYVVVVIGGEPVREAAEEGNKGEAEFRREEGVEESLEEGPYAH